MADHAAGRTRLTPVQADLGDHRKRTARRRTGLPRRNVPPQTAPARAPCATARTSTTFGSPAAESVRSSTPSEGSAKPWALKTSTESGEYPKVRLRTEATDSGQPLRIKIEINTHERSPAMAPVRLPFTLDTQWHQGQADVLTFRPAELVATKICALHQRKKGRDLFDLWLALTAMDLTGSEILAAFAPYRPAKFTARSAIETLNAKLADQTFRHDLGALVVAAPGDYDVDVAAQLVEEELLSRL